MGLRSRYMVDLNALVPRSKHACILNEFGRAQKPEEQVNLAQDLYELHKREVLIIGSDNVVHNLRMIQWNDAAYDWADAFNTSVKKIITSEDDYSKLIDYSNLENSKYAILLLNITCLYYIHWD